MKTLNGKSNNRQEEMGNVRREMEILRKNQEEMVVALTRIVAEKLLEVIRF